MGLLARMFLGRGELPADLRAELEAEGVIVLAEGLRGSVTYRNFHAPGSSAAYRKVGAVGALAVTERRLVVCALEQRFVDVTWDRAGELDVTAQDDGLKVAFDAERFADDRRGRIELFLRTADAVHLAAAITARGA